MIYKLINFVKHIFIEKKKTDLEAISESVSKVSDIDELVRIIVSIADQFSIQYETAFRIDDNDRIYDAMTVLLESKIDYDTTNEKEWHGVFEIIRHVLIRYSSNDVGYTSSRVNNFIECASFFQEEMRKIDFSKKDASQGMYAISSILAKYIEPSKEYHSLIVESMTIMHWIPFFLIFSRRINQIKAKSKDWSKLKGEI